VLFLLLLSAITEIEAPAFAYLFQMLLMLLLILYATMTLRRLSQRKRPVADATLWFWRIGTGALILSMLLGCCSCWIYPAPGWLPLLEAILFAGFALSIVLAMFYKIVPFLTWFHLNSQGYFTAPMMHEVIHPKTAMKHLFIHLLMLTAYLAALLIPSFVYLAALLTIVSFGWMLWQIIHAQRLYKKTQESGKKFEMNTAGS
jgi:hypothetical protein